MNESNPHGLLVLDKPIGMTSRAALDRAARWFAPRTKIGHAGTLDPLASGVLVLCLGQARRLVEYVQDLPKTYETEWTLGARSATDDAEGPINFNEVPVPPSHDQVVEALRAFRGEIEQTPPAFSAAKVSGRRAYDLARRGEAVALSMRRVTVHRIKISEFAFPRLALSIDCSKGTYIRSLARDFGERLGCGAYVSGLRRTRIGSFDAAQAVSLEASPESVRERLLPIEQAIEELPRITVSPDDVRKLSHGMAIAARLPAGATDAAACDAEGRLVAVVRTAPDGESALPAKVFAG